MSYKHHRLTPNPDFAAKCREIMGRGEWSTLPHNWEAKMTKQEWRSVFRAKAKFALKTAREGGDLPRGWCSGLTQSELKKVYDARGYGSLSDGKFHRVEAARAYLKAEEERKEWLKSHGGQHTQDVMAEAAKARRARKEYLTQKRHAKDTRRAMYRCPQVRLDQTNRRLLDYKEYQSYSIHCSYFRAAAKNRTPPTLKEMRDDIVSDAKLDRDLINARNYLLEQRDWKFITDAVAEVGIFNTDEYKIFRLPELYQHKMFDWMRECFVGRTLTSALLIAEAITRDCNRQKLAKSIDCKGTSSNSRRQLRALGFVA